MGRTVTASIGPHYEEFIREGLRRLEEDEARLAILKAALDEGIASPNVENFDPESFLQELKAKRKANL